MSAQLLELSEGFSCYSSSEREARVIYKEIFTEHCYDMPNLPEAPFVIDAGANIGLFSLYMKQKYPLSRILAFEPAPETIGVLGQNLALHNVSDVKTHHSGLGETGSSATFTYYPNAPGNSTLYSDQKDELKELVVERYPEHGELIMEKWLGGAIQIDIHIQRLSHFLDDEKDLKSIDLLKLDVEGAEFDVLNGLDEKHWAILQNIVLEISDIRKQGILEKMTQLLESKGFHVKHESSDQHKITELYIVKGCRTKPPSTR